MARGGVEENVLNCHSSSFLISYIINYLVYYLGINLLISTC